MRTLVVWAVAAAAVVAGLEALFVALGLDAPVWAVVALPCAAACAAFLFSGRRRAVRLRRERRARASRARRPEVGDTPRSPRAPSGTGDLALVQVQADAGALER